MLPLHQSLDRGEERVATTPANPRRPLAMITVASYFPCLLSPVLLSLGDGGGDGGVLPRGGDGVLCVLPRGGDGVLYVLPLYPQHDGGDDGGVLYALPLYPHDDDDDDGGVLFSLLLSPRRGGGACIDDDRLRAKRRSGTQILGVCQCGRQHPQSIPFR